MIFLFPNCKVLYVSSMVPGNPFLLTLPRRVCITNSLRAISGLGHPTKMISTLFKISFIINSKGWSIRNVSRWPDWEWSCLKTGCDEHHHCSSFLESMILCLKPRKSSNGLPFWKDICQTTIASWIQKIQAENVTPQPLHALKSRWDISIVFVYVGLAVTYRFGVLCQEHLE